MAKATKRISQTSATRNVRRRRNSQRGAALRANTHAMKRGPAVAGAPTELGRSFLSGVAELRKAWAAHADRNFEGEEAFLETVASPLQERLARLAYKICKRPIASLSQWVDHAIVGAHYADDREDEDTNAAERLITAVLGIAGIRRAECIVDV